ncbi:MAG: flavodoxin domain-containing protein [Gaiellaceae bacterium]|jgi:menaquinone-dependent protoporphyrinogen oxidase
METVLVTYATKRGSTREVAADIARVIRQSGFEVEILPAREVERLDRYRAVVIGGALYMGRWHKDARKLLERRRGELASLPVAVFAMGPKNTEPEELERAAAQLERALRTAPEVKPVSTAVFGGVYSVGKKHAFDARDWNAIQAWGEEVAAKLVAAGLR